MSMNLNSKRWCYYKKWGYLFACIGVFLAFVTRFSLQSLLNGSLPLLFFQINTLVIAFFFGIGPSMLTVAISVPIMAYFFLEPFGEFTVIDARDINLMIVYVAYTIVSCTVLEWLRREQYTSKMAIMVAQTRLKLLVENDQISRKNKVDRSL